jgi:hypothetical protein
MAAALMSGSLLGGRAAPAPRCGRSRRACAPARAAAAAGENLGFKTMRRGVKEAADETVLTPRFYTTDFDEMEELFSLERNPGLPMDEFEAMLSEFKTDYNQTHFVRNETFKRAADGITGDTRKIFIEFLERSCTAEFSGFLLYKELGRRLKKTNPVGARPPRCAGRPGARAGRRGAPRRGAPETRAARARSGRDIHAHVARRGAPRRLPEQGDVGLQPGAGPGLPDQEPQVHLLPAAVHLLRHVPVGEGAAPAAPPAQRLP